MNISRVVTMLITLIIFNIVTSSVSVRAADMGAMGTATYSNSDQLKWGNAPPALPGGATMSVLLGDPGKPGPFVVRFRTPGEYRIPPHFHSRAETLTVISGTLFIGGGGEFDPASAHTLTVGGFHYLPAKTPHYAFTKTPTVVEIHGEGPFDIIYINPEDDPQKGVKRSY